MFKIQCLDSKTEEANRLYSKLLIGPLPKGQGLTVGNTLRRVLLTELPGIAIVGVRIANVKHEFANLDCLQEDIVEIILNLKQICFKGKLEKPLVLGLTKNSKGIITAEDFELDSQLTIVNPFQYIGMLTKDSNFELEVLIDNGKNYILSQENLTVLESDFIPVDAIFMPVHKVNFFIEPTKLEVTSEVENLVLEISTNGTLKPLDALFYAADLLENVFKTIKSNTDTDFIYNEIELPQIEQEDKVSLENILIEELELSVRAYNCLKRANIHNLGELLQYSEDDLLAFKNFGQKSAKEVMENLKTKFNKTLN